MPRRLPCNIQKPPPTCATSRSPWSPQNRLSPNPNRINVRNLRTRLRRRKRQRRRRLLRQRLNQSLRHPRSLRKAWRIVAATEIVLGQPVNLQRPGVYRPTVAKGAVLAAVRARWLRLLTKAWLMGTSAASNLFCDSDNARDLSTSERSRPLTDASAKARVKLLAKLLLKQLASPRAPRKTASSSHGVIDQKTCGEKRNIPSRVAIVSAQGNGARGVYTVTQPSLRRKRRLACSHAPP